MTIAIWVVLGLTALATGFNFMAYAVLYRDIQLAMMALAAETGVAVRVADKAPFSQ